MHSVLRKGSGMVRQSLTRLFLSTCISTSVLVALPSVSIAQNAENAVDTQSEAEPVKPPRQSRKPRGFSISVDGVTISSAPEVNYTEPDNQAQAEPVQTAATKPARPKKASKSKKRKAPEVDPIQTGSLPKPAVKPQANSVDIEAVDAKTLEDVAIEVTYDSGDLAPHLSVAAKLTDPDARTFTINPRSNYPAFIEKAELVLLSPRRADGNRQVLGSVPVALNQSYQWSAPATGHENSYYALRVYDQHGRFDQTEPQLLHHGLESDADKSEAKQSIRLHGGTVTIAGRDMPDGAKVGAFGEAIATSGDTFKIKRILPPGDHVVDVKVKATDGQSLSFGRDVNIAANDWFYVAMADFTLGHKHENLVIEGVSDDEFSDVYTKGRLSFYLKGKIRGKYLLTASADTQDGDLKSMFRRLSQKDSQSTLKRINPDAYYPVYGDGSTSIDDAPTSGNFYVRVERGDSHVMWGDYKTTISGTQLLQHNRSLYGAHGALKTKATTEKGAHRASAQIYAAQPDTLSQREQFLGTGGSIYVLNRQDIVAGSETVQILVKDTLSGRIVERRTLTPEDGYDLNTIQGILTLSKPLARSAGQSDLLSSASDSDLVSIVDIQYDFTPISTEVEGYSAGGRAEAWLTERVRIGATGHFDNTGEVDQHAFGVDARIELGEKSWLEMEYATSEGEGSGIIWSTDGGFTSTTIASAGEDDKSGESYAVRGEIDLSDLRSSIPLKVSGFAEHSSAGFSAGTKQIDVDQDVWGVIAQLDVTDTVTAKLGHQVFRDADGKRQDETEASIAVDVTDKVTVELGAQYVDQIDPSATSGNGRRVDVGGKLSYQHDEDTKLYVFGQQTVDRTGTVERNNRIGVGAEHKFGLRLSAHGEIYTSTAGVGGEAGLTYKRDKDREIYVTYVHDALIDRFASTSDSGAQGMLVFGARHNYTEELSTHMESGYRFGGDDQTISYAQGVTYAPGDHWTITGQLETAEDEEHLGDVFERKAYSLSVGFKDGEDFTANIRSEFRFDDSTDPSKQRDTYMVLGGLSYRVSNDWVFQADAQAIHSTTDQTSILNGEYYETNVGFAYRPVDNNRFNGLFRYRFLYDLPAADQVDFSGNTYAPAQHSHILSADGTYQLNSWLSVGGKYGFRYGEASTSRLEEDFTSNTAHLGIARADLRIVKKWDALLEARVLQLREADQVHYGSLAAVYRHIGDNMKVGLGYNFGIFSDDLADLTLNDRGSFVNVVGKF